MAPEGPCLRLLSSGFYTQGYICAHISRNKYTDNSLTPPKIQKFNTSIVQDNEDLDIADTQIIEKSVFVLSPLPWL